MNIAVMGAGLSGLACAIELEKHGIRPTIFEHRSEVGDRFVNGEAFISVFSRPIMDEVRYLAEEHGIFLKPSANIRKLIIHSSNRKATFEGALGFATIRGRHKDSLEKQLAQQVQSTIHFNSDLAYEDLMREFTHVVVATGDASYAEKIQPFQRDLTVTLTGGTAEGDFSRFSASCWFSNQFAPHGGNGFLIPFSDQEATVVLAFPEYNGLAAYDKEALWNRFFERVCRDLGQDLTIKDTFEVNQFIIGVSQYPRLGNTFFTGNCFGAVMPMMGFGQFPSIMTGIYAARDICGLGRYEQLTAVLRRSHADSLVLRRWMESLDDEGMDKVVERLNSGLGNKMVNSKVNFLRYASYAARLWLATPIGK